MNRTVVRVLLLGLAAAGGLAPARPGSGPARLDATETNRVILRVNDRIATLLDYEVRRNERLRAIQQADLDPARRAELTGTIGADVLSNLLDELLVLSRADQIGFTPTNEEIDAAVARSREGFGIQTDEQFVQALAASGMTEAAFRQQVATNLRVTQVMASEVQRRVLLEEEDLRRFYYEHEEQFVTPERLRLQEIVVLDSTELTEQRRRELADELAAALAAGESMSELAATHREQGTTSGVVELGWIVKGDLDPALEAAVWDLPVGETSAPVAGRGGLHLLQVLERTPSALREFKDVASEIEARERNRLLTEEYESYLTELREAAYIRVAYLPPDAKGFRVQDSASRITLESPLVESITLDPDGLETPELEVPEAPTIDEAAAPELAEPELDEPEPDEPGPDEPGPDEPESDEPGPEDLEPEVDEPPGPDTDDR